MPFQWHCLPPTPSGFLQWFRRLRRTLLPASGDLGRTFVCGSPTVKISHPNSLRLSPLEWLPTCPSCIVTHTLARSAHGYTPLWKSVWDIVGLRDTILPAQRSCGADAACLRSSAVVSFVRSAQVLRISLPSLRPVLPQAFCSKYGLANFLNLSAVSLQLFPSTRALSSAAMHANLRAAVLSLYAINGQCSCSCCHCRLSFIAAGSAKQESPVSGELRLRYPRIWCSSTSYWR